MIPGLNPFKKTPSQVISPASESGNPISENIPSANMESQAARAAPSSSKLPPPAPSRRASAKKTPTISASAINGGPVIVEEVLDEPSTATYRSGELDEADRNELDDLERQSQAVSPNGVRKSTDSQRPTTRPRRLSSLQQSSATKAPHQSTPTSTIGAPQINGASTPRPFGDDLPTPEIISRDLSVPTQEGDDRRSSVGGGVTSAGLVDPGQSMPIVSENPHVATKARRRPSSTGPILCALGCGTMGRSILSGVLDAIEESGVTMHASGLLPPARFIACVRRESAALKLQEEWGDLVNVVRGADNNAKAVSESDYVLLGSKPQVARDILTTPGMQEALAGKVLISILAGTTIATLQSLCPQSKIIRVMPNTPSRIRKGMSVIVSGEGVSETHLELVSWIFNQVGKTLIMDEKHIDAATAMCGSGPAFMAVILESMTDGGVMMGIPRAQAEELAAQTMLGTASMVQAGQHPALIRNAVATPGGCTIGGLLEMEDGKIRSTMARTIQTATNIAAGLGKN